MFIDNHYIVKPQIMHMTGHYDRNGKLCSIITETNKTIITDQSPFDTLDGSLRAVGFTLRGAMESSRWHHGNASMCPVMVNPVEQVVLFPTHSANNEDTIWFNPDHIKRTFSFNRKTLVQFSNGTYLIVNIRLSAFNNKLTTAEQYKALTIGLATSTFTLTLYPENRKLKKRKKKQ